MIVSDKDSEELVFTTYEEAKDYFNKNYGYAIINFKMKGKIYYMVTFE